MRFSPRRALWISAIAGLVVVASACGSDPDSGEDSGFRRATSSPTPTEAAGTPTPLPGTNDPATLEGLTPAEQRNVGVLSRLFPEIDWTMNTVDLTSITSGGPGRDGGIPSLQDPNFEVQANVDWLDPQEPVIALEINGEARAYPIQVLMWHEIVTDTVGGVPVTVTFCPLCNTGIVFDRRVDGEARRFGVSGLLRESDLIMYDYTNASLWQQITGEAIVGVDAGTRLTFIPSQIISWAQFQESFADALVLSRNTGFNRNYGLNPYPGYDSVGSSTLFSTSFDDARLEAKERVLTVELAEEAIAFPFSELSEHGVLTASIGETALVALWTGGTLSSLDDSVISRSGDIGSAGVFIPSAGERELTFEVRDGDIVDAETGSVWNVLGRAVAGPMAGEQLEQVVSANHFWFAWSIFQPQTRVIRG
jgi:hypothetical protein